MDELSIFLLGVGVLCIWAAIIMFFSREQAFRRLLLRYLCCRKASNLAVEPAKVAAVFDRSLSVDRTQSTQQQQYRRLSLRELSRLEKNAGRLSTAAALRRTRHASISAYIKPRGDRIRRFPLAQSNVAAHCLSFLPRLRLIGFSEGADVELKADTLECGVHLSPIAGGRNSRQHREDVKRVFETIPEDSSATSG